ncbi:2-C-methyl-D-erythritol 4-phosphate cytidylyltransferase [Psychrobacter alimentarius]|uniref:2-C-methyl-D-erythritol 4-phosphate cytidylyltransferase n=2 Tax=Moraxellaceae TaxID=468 RepID=A0ABN4N5Z2_9GAMM|nr:MULTISPECIES: 2-C-methyl-D-erythritol 4-phosphate cytidylyltransferase [Psychrobacter]AMT97670.1 2-C-methyl-D-erythritol 4-phosphate cytidylyltransferase [Psychrobacter alimentarius]QCB30038.1 2-C-methyl-D-erythritol 4-phosphate cytidylyltransferase [Psychrobacter sp. PAMC27889]
MGHSLKYYLMNPLPRTYAMIVAAGRGSRFGASVAKQYTQLQDQTLLQLSVARLASSKYINQCLLVVAEDDITARTLDFAIPVYYALGGVERWQSVQAGVSAIGSTGADDSDLVLIHDAARPAVPSHDIDQVIKAALLEPYGAILATPVADTLKTSYIKSVTTDNLSDKNNQRYYAKRTIDRSSMWQAQTPQVFRLGALKKVLNYVAEHQLTITDEASAFEYLDLPIRLVTGSRQNIKLTYPDDALLLSAILTAQSDQP